MDRNSTEAEKTDTHEPEMMPLTNQTISDKYSILAHTAKILHEVEIDTHPQNREHRIGRKWMECFQESFAFLKEVYPAIKFMLCNSIVGAMDILLLFFLQAKLPEKGLGEWWLGVALLLMEVGGIVGARLILKVPNMRYKWIFMISTMLVLIGLLAEHASLCQIMILGGFLAAMGDDALQVRTNAILQNMFPSKQRATLTSIESFSFSVVMIVLSPLAGFFFTYW